MVMAHIHTKFGLRVPPPPTPSSECLTGAITPILCIQSLLSLMHTSDVAFLHCFVGRRRAGNLRTRGTQMKYSLLSVDPRKPAIGLLASMQASLVDRSPTHTQARLPPLARLTAVHGCSSSVRSNSGAKMMDRRLTRRQTDGPTCKPLNGNCNGGRTAWVASVVPWVRTPWVVGQLWGTDGVSRRTVAWTLLCPCRCY